MIEESGRVVAVEERLAVVETVRKSACDACSAQNACGQGLKRHISDHSASHMHIRALCDFPVREGDAVVIGIPESAMLRASFWVYLSPLLFLIVAIGFGSWLGLPEGYLIIFSLLVLGAGFGITACLFHNENRQKQLQPVVLSWQLMNQEKAVKGVSEHQPAMT
ncbi:SoxR reducing system RseC family protein [Kistimonas asteriae]|uniref:SoxR reducing system RseC family protein n=1 Tax=Kistimonas asteriae TaxID=517724 RepID=UPI001BAA48C6|nr:SoxR reducing system RseC family protein [Kistimonas asteriae]